MNIEIKNIKYAAFQSRETACFQATVYVDGKRSFIVSNDGQGGCNDYHPLKAKKGSHHNVYKQVTEINDKLKKTRLPCSFCDVSESCNDENHRLENCLDLVIGDKLTDWLVDKDIAKSLKKITFFSDGKIMTINRPPSEENYAGFKKHVNGKYEYVILNDLSKDDVRYVFRNQALPEHLILQFKHYVSI